MGDNVAGGEHELWTVSPTGTSPEERCLISDQSGKV